MSAQFLPSAAFAIVDWLSEVGPRWGLPEKSCQVHALLFLYARPISQEDIGQTLNLTMPEVQEALPWLVENGLANKTPNGWITEADPWSAFSRVMEARRERELMPARETLNAWRCRPEGVDPIVARQAKRLHNLVEDLAAIDAGTRRLSSKNSRRLVNVAGRAVRIVDRTLGGGTRK